LTDFIIGGSQLGSNISTGEIVDGAVTDAKLAAATQAARGGTCILLYSPASVGAGTWVLTIDAQAYQSAYFNNFAAAANGDNCTFYVSLGAGTYAIKALVLTGNNRGVLDIDIGGTEVASFDTYAAVAMYNVEKSQTGINIATSGIKELRLRVDGRNVASSGYLMSLIALTIYRTA
jgi:hypothetical protein